MRYVTSAKGEKIVITRSGEILITDDNGREREKHKVPYGATLQVADGQQSKPAPRLASLGSAHAPDHRRVLGSREVRECRGRGDGRQADRRGDRAVDAGGHRSEARRQGAEQGPAPAGQVVRRPRPGSQDARQRSPGHHHLPGRRDHQCLDGQQISVGDVLARLPQESAKTRDITGGLPRVAELFEARTPKDAGMLAEFTGTMSFGKDTKGKQRLVITDLDGITHEYLILKDKHVLVHDGQVVNKGESIVDGAPDPHDILRLLGVEALAIYITDEVQDVYRLQGVKINDKHIEVIVRQMLRRVNVLDPGDTKFIKGSRSSVRICSTRMTG
jgi:DNA-directed RNA polymerase subunit beta'